MHFKVPRGSLLCHTTGKAIGAFPKGSDMFWAYLTLHPALSGEIHPSGQLLWILMLWISLAKYPPLQVLLFNAWFRRCWSMQTLTFPFGFWVTTMLDTHSVGSSSLLINFSVSRRSSYSFSFSLTATGKRRAALLQAPLYHQLPNAVCPLSSPGL